jgi:hypothetical protein
MANLIDRTAFRKELVDRQITTQFFNPRERQEIGCIIEMLDSAPAVDAVEVVRCGNCAHAEPLERNCELNGTVYMHCRLGRGEEAKNVWHKYKKYYKDYSLVDRDDFCTYGERWEDDG